MTSESMPQLLQKPREKSSRPQASPYAERPARELWAWLADGVLVGLFLILTFLLGVFPLKDVDFYWHLRTGDLIRQTGTIPHADIFTFTAAPGTPWIDLHWLFQIAISWGREHGGIVGLNLIKCGITCAALLLLVTARRRDWPIWIMLLAWLPALLVLSGRMYIRPETLTLLYLSIFLAIVSRWDRFPRLALLLPFVQVAWVNSHGLFVLGPIILAFGLIDAVLRSGAFTSERKNWWRIIVSACAGCLLACLINPYFLSGALYPLALAGTMRNPIFSNSIAELMPIPVFIESSGWRNLPLQLHFLTIILGALSFLIPLLWAVSVRLSPRTTTENTDSAAGDAAATRRTLAPREKMKSRSKFAEKKRSRAATGAVVATEQERTGWRISPFRLLLYVSFCALSMQATRNSHQFAAVVGALTAWNFGEWGSAVLRHRARNETTLPGSSSISPRWIALIAIVSALVWVGSGQFYSMAGEGRVIQLGEQPLWFPHEAVQFAGRPGMPGRFLSFHNGHASLYEYYHGPEHKVYTDPRLEVAGADLFQRYRQLEDRMLRNQPGWEDELDRIGRPVILVDHEFNSGIGTTLLASAHWRCVWFDAIAAVFLHDSFVAATDVRPVDFAARHFQPDPPRAEPIHLAEHIALGKAYRSYVQGLSQIRSNLARPLVWLGMDNARRVIETAPDSLDGWKIQGQIELSRDLAPPSPRRFRTSYDAVTDLSLSRATYSLRRALELVPGDFLTLMELKRAYDARAMYEAALPLADRLLAVYPKNKHQLNIQEFTRSERPDYLRKLGESPATTWRNLSELDQIVAELLDKGRIEMAAELLERANPPERASWEIVDRIATCWLQLGEPVRARNLWQVVSSAKGGGPGLRDSRIGTTYLVEGDFGAARRFFGQACQSQPELFEALYSLAVLEQDAGNAAAALEHARKAMQSAPDAIARAAARTIAFAAEGFVPQPDRADPQNQ